MLLIEHYLENDSIRLKEFDMQNHPWENWDSRYWFIVYASQKYHPLIIDLQPPVPVKRWEGVYDATKDGPACPQPLLRPVSEDCLFLNVHTPKVLSKIFRVILVKLSRVSFSFLDVEGILNTLLLSTCTLEVWQLLLETVQLQEGNIYWIKMLYLLHAIIDWLVWVRTNLQLILKY